MLTMTALGIDLAVIRAVKTTTISRDTKEGEQANIGIVNAGDVWANTITMSAGRDDPWFGTFKGLKIHIGDISHPVARQCSATHRWAEVYFSGPE